MVPVKLIFYHFYYKKLSFIFNNIFGFVALGRFLVLVCFPPQTKVFFFKHYKILMVGLAELSLLLFFLKNLGYVAMF